MNNRPPAPLIPVMRYNAIDPDDLGGSNLITYANYPTAEDGDELTPQWWGRSAQGEAVDYGMNTLPILYDSFVADPVLGMPLDIDNDLLQKLRGGEVFYSYLMKKRSEDTLESLRLFFIIGRHGELFAPQVKDSHEEQLDPDFSGPTFTLVAPPYWAMAVGDVVTLRWLGVRPDGSAFPPVTRVLRITAAQVGKVMSWSIPRGEAGKVRGGRVELSYTITYASPTLKPTAVSGVRHLAVVAPTDDRLEAPRIKNFSGSELDPSAYPQGITLVVPIWADLRGGDLLVVFGLGNRDDRTVIRHQIIDLSNLDTGRIEVLLAQEWLQANNGLPVKLSYQFMRRDAGVASELLELDVLVPMNLPIPVVEGVIVADLPLHGKLQTELFATTGVTVNLPAAANIPNDATVRMWWQGFGELIEAELVPGESRKFKVPATAIPANLDRVVEIYYSVRKQGTPEGVPDSVSQYYKLSVLKVPQVRWPIMVCEKASAGNPGSLKRGDVPAHGVAVYFNPVKWIYLADNQYIEMWLTGVGNVREEIVARRRVTAAEASIGVRLTLLPQHLASLPVNNNFTIHFVVSFDDNETDVTFRSLSLRLLA